MPRLKKLNGASIFLLIQFTIQLISAYCVRICVTLIFNSIWIKHKYPQSAREKTRCNERRSSIERQLEKEREREKQKERGRKKIILSLILIQSLLAHYFRQIFHIDICYLGQITAGNVFILPRAVLFTSKQNKQRQKIYRTLLFKLRIQ